MGDEYVRQPFVMWSEEAVDHLHFLIAEGLPQSAIGARLGMTRSAIAGKIDREGLVLMRSAKNPDRPVQAPTRVRKRKPKLAAMPSRTASRPSKPEPCRPPPDVVLPDSVPIDLMGLNAATCRWPIGDPCEPGFFFCGAPPRDGKPYCGGHCAIAYYNTPNFTNEDRDRLRRRWLAKRQRAVFSMQEERTELHLEQVA